MDCLSVHSSRFPPPGGSRADTCRQIPSGWRVRGDRRGRSDCPGRGWEARAAAPGGGRGQTGAATPAGRRYSRYFLGTSGPELFNVSIKYFK